VGYEKIAIFDEYLRNDTRWAMVTVEHQQELVCDLAIYHMVPFPMILSDA